MSYTINPNAKNRWARNAENTMDLSLETDASSVYLDNGRTLEQEIGEGSMVSNVATIDSGMEKVIDGTYDGAYESCKMYGKSLVNLATHSKRQNIKVQNLLDSNGRLSWNTTGAWGKVGFTVQGKPNSTYCVKYGDKHTTLRIYVRYVDGLSGTTQPITALNSTCKKFTTDTTGIFTLALEQVEATTDSWIQDFVILEYQEGMENWDIPYFEGLCDVKMPILRSVGKNLINEQNNTDGRFIWTTGEEYSDSNTIRTDFVRVPSNTTVYSDYKAHFFLYDRDKQYLGVNEVGNKTSSAGSMKNTLTIDSSVTYVRIYWDKTSGENNQLTVSSTATPYENHKTNILETSNDIVLRGLPNGVKDSYDCLTGEYVQRIGEVVYNNTNVTGFYVSDSYQKEGCTTFMRPVDETFKKEPKMISNLLPFLPTGHWNDVDECLFAGTVLVIRLKSTKASNVTELQEYLSQHPLVVQYELAEPITTTIESSTIPFAYENGHIILESGHEGQSLLPTLEYSTVINKTGQVENVAKTIQRQEKQLTMLEKMLIQNIINLDYNNTLLTLKNEMEEML